MDTFDTGPTSANIHRRDFVKTGLAAAAGGVFSIGSSAKADSPYVIDSQFKGAIPNAAVPRWQDDLPILTACAPLSNGTPPAEYNGKAVGDVLHGTAPEYFDHPSYWDEKPTQFYRMEAVAAVATILPASMNLQTPLWRYEGIEPNGVRHPAPQFRFEVGRPAIVRFTNRLPEELSVHMHGGHWPSHSDGHASFLCLPGEERDYYYPNVLPRIPGTDKPDVSEGSSSMWFHDHAADMTAIHVARGLVGTAPSFDALELGLIRDGVLPGVRGTSDVGPAFSNPYDIWLAFTDRVFHPTGATWYDSNSHNGYLGNVDSVNGKAYPKLKVEARKYRFRLHCANTARHRRFRLSNGASFLRIANDAFLFPKPQRVQALVLSPGKRADVIIDFSKYRPGTRIIVENILPQENPRGPDGTLEDAENPEVTGKLNFRHELLMFEVVAANPAVPNATITDDTSLRPHQVITERDIVARREFKFERKNGQWAINGAFYDERIANACPTLNTAEEWTLTNGSGGWWHPIHIHLESHQHVRNNTTGAAPWYQNSFKQDITMLGPNTSITVRQRFRTFKGPFVFHCHNNEHEDLEMMFQFDPRAVGSLQPQLVQRFFR